ncbi:hypothetical protein SDC9_91919 [bioreactor metagenome]|uniref:Uncharacterized protein n=1 Tax=bioreactor metagenome TaxID=1076179 RepID=A0A645A300_9ZZZZ
MFQAGSYGKALIKSLSLITTHGSLTKDSIRIRVFSISFGNTPPTGITAHINHRGKGPIDTTQLCLLRGNTAALFHQSGVPTACLGKRYGENGAEPMYGIISEKDGYAQPGVFHGMALHPVSQIGLRSKINK